MQWKRPQRRSSRVKDLAITLFLHCGKDSFDGVHSAAHCALELLVEVLPGDGLDGGLLRGRIELIPCQSVVDENVDPSAEGISGNLESETASSQPSGSASKFQRDLIFLPHCNP